MMIVAFDWTSRALIAGHKWVTRRDWSQSHRAKFHAGDIVAAWDKSPRAGGKPIATIALTESPSIELTNTMTNADYVGEGFAYLMRYPGETPECRAQALRIASPENFTAWKFRRSPVTVVRFKLVSVLPAGIALLNDDECRELAGRLSLGATRTHSFPEGARRAILAAAAAAPGRVYGAVSAQEMRAIERTEMLV